MKLDRESAVELRWIVKRHFHRHWIERNISPLSIVRARTSYFFKRKTSEHYCCSTLNNAKRSARKGWSDLMPVVKIAHAKTEFNYWQSFGVHWGIIYDSLEMLYENQLHLQICLEVNRKGRSQMFASNVIKTRQCSHFSSFFEGLFGACLTDGLRGNSVWWCREDPRPHTVWQTCLLI